MSTQKLQKLEDQAATAALYATRPGRGSSRDRQDRLDNNSRLSSAGAATSLKHANPRDLPSYPSAGLTGIESSAEAAATLANANHQTFEYWKPDISDVASKAAILAKNYKSTESWQPQMSSTGSRAAALAATDIKNVAAWRPEATAASNSAAEQAMRGTNLTHQPSRGNTNEGNKKALLAATGAMSNGRKRSGSSPITKSTYPDAENSAANALSAASFANNSPLRVGQARKDVTPGQISATMDAAQLRNAAITNLSREMYTSNPPVAPEVEEKNRQAGQRAAAISMAKQMYEIQQKAIAQAQGVDKSDSQSAASYLHHRKQSVTSTEDAYQFPPHYANLQEAAQKLAVERLAKLHDEHAAYRNYYGTNSALPSRLSVRNRPRRRASSDGAAHETDDISSKLAHSEMSVIGEKSAQVDAKKRQKDRDLLMAAAQRNVKASIQSMDEKVFADTGRASPAMVEDWESKANARAKAASEERMLNHGKVNIGGGKYLDQSEIDTIAARRVQPTLDEISEKATLQRARDAHLRHEEQERNRIAATRIQDEKERNMKTKVEWKRFRDEEKHEAKARKEEQKAKRADENHTKTDKKHEITSEGLGSLPSIRAIPVGASGFSPLSPGSLGTEARVIEEPQEQRSPPSDEATFAAPESLKLSPQEITRSAEDETNQAEAVSEVDPTLLDPALRKSDGEEVDVLDINQGGFHSSASTFDAEVIATRVLNAPLKTNIPHNETVVPNETKNDKFINAAEKVPLALKADFSHPSRTKDSARESPESPGSDVPSESRDTHLISTQSALIDSTATPKSPKGESRVSSWLKTKFGRRTTKSTEQPISSSSRDPPNLASPNVLGQEDAESDGSPKYGTSFHNEEGSTSVATKTGERNSHTSLASLPEEIKPTTTSHSIKSTSSEEGVREIVPTLEQRTPSSHEDFEEAQDQFDSENIAPLADPVDDGHGFEKQVRDSKFQENL